jgi:4-hydroxy-2-oxoheptanedioate aldolase
MVPMVETAEMATGIVRATRYPPHGIRGVGSAIGRASRWNRRAGYLQKASEEICVVVQLETVAAIKNLHAIAQVEGVDGIFLGPSDLAADMGYLGNAQHCDVQMLIENALAELNKLGVPAGILMADEALAKRYLELGVSFIAVGTDISLLARGAEQLCARFRSMNGES